MDVPIKFLTITASLFFISLSNFCFGHEVVAPEQVCELGKGPYSFGFVMGGKDFNFTIQNKLGASIAIDDIKLGCGCIGTDFRAKELNSDATISIKFSSKKANGFDAPFEAVVILKDHRAYRLIFTGEELMFASPNEFTLFSGLEFTKKFYLIGFNDIEGVSLPDGIDYMRVRLIDKSIGLVEISGRIQKIGTSYVNLNVKTKKNLLNPSIKFISMTSVEE